VGISLLQGLSVLIVIVGVFVMALRRGHSEDDARALAFTTLIIANVGLIFANRSWSRLIVHTLRSPNSALWWVTGGALLFLGLALYVPFLRKLFRFSFLHPVDLAICFAAGAVSILWFELLKLVNRRKTIEAATR